MDSIPQLQGAAHADAEILESKRSKFESRGNHEESNMSIKSEEIHSAAPALPHKLTTKSTLVNSYNSPADIQHRQPH